MTRDELLSELRGSVLEGPADLDVPTRQAMAARAAWFAQTGGDPPVVPESWQEYVDKVAQHAYKVTDETIDHLRERHPEHEIYEATIAAALGAASERLAAGLRALRGER